MAHRQKHRDAAAYRRLVANIKGINPADVTVLDEDRPATTATDPLEVSAYAEAILKGLQRKPVYQGPVPDHRMRGRRLSEEVIAHRRVRGRIAKRQRKINRPRRKRTNLVPLAWLLLASIIIGAAAGLSFPQANATPLSYLDDLNGYGLVVYDTTAALATGYQACLELNTSSGDVVARNLYARTTWSDVPDLRTAATIVVAAVENLCPWNDHRGDRVA